MSDNSPETLSPDGGTKGFAIGVNLTGSDDSLRLWKIDGAQITKVVNCAINWQSDIGTSEGVKITVERSQEGNWIVTVTRLNGSLIGTSYGTDSELFSIGWFGIYYKYSSTRDRLLWIDDINIEGSFYEDQDAPVVLKCEPSGKKSVDITLNEKPADGIMIPENMLLNTEENKSVSVKRNNDLVYRVEFAKEFINRSINNLLINILCDESGNCSQKIIMEFTPVWAGTGDIIISEIMADPSPVVSLPGKEYIEITNRTGYTFNLKNWKLSTESQSAQFPEH